MSKENDFLDLGILSEKVDTKERKLTANVASPASRMVSGKQRDSVMDRTIRRRDEKRDLQKKISDLENQIQKVENTIVLDMPISKSKVKFTKVLLDPMLIDVSAENQRIQTLLDPESVSDIFESILTEGQTEPGFLRKKSDGRYELISGSRRLFCVKQIPERQYLALVGDIPDIDVRRLSRLENQQSPISVYERALSFKHDVDHKKVKSWEALAALEGLSDRQMKKYKALSELPIEIVRSFSSPADLSLVFADWIISKIRSSATIRNRFVEIAKTLIEEKRSRASGDPARQATEVMAKYKSAVRVKSVAPTRKKSRIYKSKDGAMSLKHSISNKGTHKLEFVNIPDDKVESQIISVIRDLGLGGA
jgi:ParB family chromosome partitioning protein